MARSRQYTRRMRAKHIKRKKSIVKQLYVSPWYQYDGMYSKGKIHCSCKMCRAKTKFNGWKPRDLRELQRGKRSGGKSRIY